MKVGILTMESYEHRQKGSVGSSRIRGEWLLNHWPDAEPFHIGQQYDAIIFQKAYWPEYLRSFKGVKIFDLCDPDWMEGKPVTECLEECDYVTTSTVALRDFVQTITKKPVECVPDRVDLSEHIGKKEHKGKAKKAVWFGYHHNQKTIDQCLSTLARLGLQLTVISDMPYYPESKVQGIDDEWIKANVINMKYDYATLCQDLIHSGDMLINPRLEEGRFKFKSNNKSVTAWALGIPVASNADDMEVFMDAEERIKEAEKNLAIVRDEYDVKQSVSRYNEIIESLQHAPTS